MGTNEGKRVQQENDYGMQWDTRAGEQWEVWGK